ncbi:MAG: Holliday junction resolvase RuvX [Flavobacteriales bacterium]
MKRIMGIDFGAKRTGIAVTDELQIIASGLTTIETEDIFTFLQNYFQTEKVETVVIGLPKRLNNEDSVIEEQIQQFIAKFKKIFPFIQLERHDERFTSKLALQTMIESNTTKKKRRNKALIDQISATIILQSFMEKKHFS